VGPKKGNHSLASTHLYLQRHCSDLIPIRDLQNSSGVQDLPVGANELQEVLPHQTGGRFCGFKKIEMICQLGSSSKVGWVLLLLLCLKKNIETTKRI